MSFNSVGYMIFLPVVSLVYFLLPKKFRNIYLVAISYYFYFVNEARFFLLLPALTLLTYLMARGIETKKGRERTAVFIASLVVNLGTLIFFKYNRFFLELLSKGTGIEFDLTWWMLPMGISFYVFMAVSYLRDVYMNKYPAEKDIVKFAAYISFFPHILMGPIDRRNKFLPQLDKDHVFDYERIRKALILMAIGLFKKIAVADVLAMFVDRIHKDLYSYSGPVLLFVAFMYSFQLYADFSGYSDIALATAKILDIDITDNFNTPYLSTNFSQFWSRWHISLSSWFQDYIFTPFVWTNPLKKISEKPPVLLAVTLVFVTSGIWHGNTWNFVIWGCCHALFRVCEELIHRKFGKPKKKQPRHIFWLKVASVFTLTTLSQIFFRCKDIPSAIYYCRNLLVNRSGMSFAGAIYSGIKTGFDATPILIYGYIAFNVASLAIMVRMDCIRYFKLKGKPLTNLFDDMKPIAKWLCYYALIAFIMAGFIMNNGGYGASASFIYNNF